MCDFTAQIQSGGLSMRAREEKKQLKALTSQYDRDKASYDALKDKDGVIARHYKSRMDKTLRQIAQLNPGK